MFDFSEVVPFFLSFRPSNRWNQSAVCFRVVRRSVCACVLTQEICFHLTPGRSHFPTDMPPTSSFLLLLSRFLSQSMTGDSLFGCVAGSSAGGADAGRGDDDGVERATQLEVGRQRRQSHPRLRTLSPPPSLRRLGVSPTQRRQQVCFSLLTTELCK